MYLLIKIQFMKKLIYSFSLMVILSTLFACNNNDAPAIEEKPLPVYSYFRGYLNNVTEYSYKRLLAWKIQSSYLTGT